MLIVALLLACTKEPEYPDYSNDREPVDSGQIDSDPGPDSDPQVDEDGDGYGPSTDCDDTDPEVHPGAEEVCNDKDDDCDEEVDEGLSQSWYVDADGDGYGSEETVEACEQPEDSAEQSGDCDDSDEDVNPGAAEDCEDQRDLDCDGDSTYVDADGDGSPECVDCDDTDADRRPGRTEVCDGIDNDCNGDVDDDADDATSWFQDGDSDGYGDGSSKLRACDQPSGYVDNATDCDDTEPLANPGETEVCDEIDNDCDGDTDEDASAGTFYVDGDGDGYGEEGSTGVESCSAPSGYADNDSDCDDADADVNPGEDEVCDEVDNDCDGDTDEDSAIDATTWYADSDSDGYGDSAYSATQCEQPSNSVDNDEDCDDSDAAISPDATEVCDSVDNDCDGTVDGSSAVDASTWYDDSDGDGYGDASSAPVACTAPSGAVSDDSDCDDTDADVFPGAEEVCDSVDNDCDSSVDEDATDATAYYADSDGDGYGDASSSVSACSTPTGYVSDDTDCDDDDAYSYPGASEICDGADNDCDGTTDEGFSATPSTWYADDDGDGYGDPDDSLDRCTQPSGYIADDSDCDDTDGSVNPAATEYCDSVDNDCDDEIDEDDAADASTWYADSDGDGYGDSSVSATACSAPSGAVADDTDCDDSDGSTYPGASETCYDGVVNDCGGTEADALAACSLSGDLDTTNAAGTFEGDGYDEAGTAALILDADGDGDLDLIVGAPGNNSDAGAVYVLTDPGSASSSRLSDSSITVTGSSNEQAGSSLAWFDADGDGAEDLIVGSPGYHSYKRGAIYWLSGPASGTGSVGLTQNMPNGSRNFGTCGDGMMAEGDLDGDGSTDLSVACTGWQSKRGQTFLFTGPISGISDLSAEADASVLGDTASQKSGSFLDAADLDGDGQDDWVVGAPGANSGAGAAWIYAGPVSGSHGPGDADFSINSSSTTDACGPVASVDHDGDGYQDLMLGCPGSSSKTGTLYLFEGPLSGSPSLGSASVTISASKEELGAQVGSAGDLDGDGNDYLLVAAPLADAKSGTTWFYYGPVSGALGTGDADASLTGTSGTESGDLLLGDFDVDGDGINEVAFTSTGAANSDGQGQAGAVYIFAGAQY